MNSNQYQEGGIITTVEKRNIETINITQAGQAGRFSEVDLSARDLEMILWSASSFQSAAADGWPPPEGSEQWLDSYKVFDQDTAYFSAESPNDKMLHIRLKAFLDGASKKKDAAIQIIRESWNELCGDRSYDELAFSYGLLTQIGRDFIGQDFLPCAGSERKGEEDYQQ